MNVLETNRISEAVAQTKKVLDAQQTAGKLTPAKVEEMSNGLNLDFEQYCLFQELKSAYMGIVLKLPEAQAIYEYLGNTPKQFNAQPLEVKLVLSKIFLGLLSRLRQGQ